MRSIAADLSSRRIRLRRPPRPTWSAWAFAVATIFVLVGVALPLLVFGERAFVVRAERAAAAVAGVLWCGLFVGLYRGARVRRDEPPPEHTPLFNTSSGSGVDALADVGPPDVGHDLVGCLLGLLLWLLFSFLLVMFLPMILEGVWLGVFVAAGGLTWVARRALRQVFAHGPRCRGRLLASATRATAFTLLYAGWLLAVLEAVRRTRV